MTKISAPITPPPCGCQNCLCRRGPRCRCHDYNALLALAIGDFRRLIRRPSALRRAQP